jgi:hypothetical protein
MACRSFHHRHHGGLFVLWRILHSSWRGFESRLPGIDQPTSSSLRELDVAEIHVVLPPGHSLGRKAQSFNVPQRSEVRHKSDYVWIR